MTVGNKLALTFVSLTAVTLLCGSAQAQKANLIMVSWTAPTTAQGYGTKIAVSFKVTNYGSAAAGAFGVRFYYGDSSATTGLTTLGTHSLSGLAAATTSSTQTVTLTLPGNVLYGGRYLHYFIDATNSVSESNENDNRDHRSLSITGYPDMKVATISVSPKTQAPGKNLGVTYRLFNAGYSRIPTFFYARFYYSLTSAINTTDTYLNKQATVSSLVAGGYYPPSSNGTTTVTVPTGATSGTRYIGVIADYNHRVNEVSIANNTGTAPFTVTGVAGKADLQMLTWSAPTSAPGYNSKVPISFRVRNAGTGTAGAFQVRFYYGLSTTTGVVYLGAYNHGALGAGANGPVGAVTGTLPNSVAHGNRYIIYLIDAGSQVAETNESNNRGSRIIYISGRPDLRVAYLTVSPTTQSPGGPVIVKYRLRNYGASMVPNLFYTRFYFSNNSVINTSDSYLNKQFSALRIMAGAYYPASTNGTLSVTVPTAAAAGIRYIGAYADYNNAVNEASETNNTLAATLTIKSSGLGNGMACSKGSQCKSTYCADGLCCNNACGNSNKSDCMACSLKAGGSKNGGCQYLAAGKLCRAATGPCDQTEVCTGKSTACPGNLFKPAKTTCRAAKDKECDLVEVCTGKAAACPNDAYKPNNSPCSKGACLKGLCAGKKPDSSVDSITSDAPVEAAVGETAPIPDGVPGNEAAPTTDAPVATGDTTEPGERGCSCRTGQGPSGGLTLALLVTALCGLIWRRRRD